MRGGSNEVFSSKDCGVRFKFRLVFNVSCSFDGPIFSRNIVTVSLMEAVGEAQVFAEKTGLGTGPMEELIGDAFGPVAGGYSKRYASSLCTFHKEMKTILTRA